MQQNFCLTPQMQEYYDSLPQSVKVSIVQSGATVNSLEDLKAVAKELTGEQQ